MAKRQQQNGHQQQLVVILMATCLIVVSLLMKLDSVSAASISLNGSGNLLQQPLTDDNGGDHNYAMVHQQQQNNKTSHSSSMEMLDDQGADSLESSSPKTDLARSQLNFGHPFQPLTLVKRASGGFIGMRGKKDVYEKDDNDNSDNSITFPWEQIQNSGEEELNWDDYANPNVKRYKKAPTAFYGVRGKKFASVNSGNPSNDNQRWQDFLQKLEEDRVRDIMLQEFFESVMGPKDLTGEMAKRAPTGFTGMRGKRPSLEDGAASMESMAKRGVGNNAFVGVRGKKDVSHQQFKRSPNSERYFFDFWKKSSDVGGGKRQRFGNKFVAVRGKKNSYKLNDNMATLYNSNMLPSSASLRLSYTNSDKRTPSGFLGMRGKRPFTSDEV